MLLSKSVIKKTTLLTVFFTIYCFVLQAKDYILYHKAINKAETQIFVNSQIDSGLATYMQTFRDFDFVYAGDCVIAMQIALYVNKEKTFLRIVQKAFQNGLMLRNLYKVFYVSRHSLFQKNKTLIDSLYKINRPHYLKRIDTITLKQMYQLFAHDQLVKNSLKGGKESISKYEKRYLPEIKKTITTIKEIIAIKGFPLDKLIGIDQSDIMKELRLHAHSMEEYYWINKNSNEYYIDKDQFTFQENYLNATLLIPIWVHYNMVSSNPYYLFDSIFFIKQISLGNIHPKDIAAINDGSYGYKNQELKEGEVYFGVGVRASLEPNSLFVPDSFLNKCRAKYFIAPIENDRAKWRFMKKNKMNYAWGYCGTRS